MLKSGILTFFNKKVINKNIVSLQGGQSEIPPSGYSEMACDPKSWVKVVKSGT